MKQNKWIYLSIVSSVVISAIVYSSGWNQRVIASTDNAVPATTWTVTKTADTNDGACNGDCSLREAIAVATAGDSIIFSSVFSSPQTIFLNSSLLINKSLSITGTSARTLTLARAPGPTLPLYSLIRITGPNPPSPGIEVNLSRLTLTGGNADGGGGIIVTFAELNLDSVTIRNNVAGDAGGGGILGVSGSILNIVNSSIHNNIASDSLSGGGGGIKSSAILNIANSSITANQAEFGGGIRSAGSVASMILNNVTVTLNAASDNSGGVIVGTAGFVRNSIIAQNSAPLGPDITGAATSMGNNLIGNSSQTTGFIHGVNGDKVGTPTALLNPQLGLLADNGGQTDTRAPGSSSPALNSANPCVIAATCPTNNPSLPLANDQRGVGFSRQGGSAVDMGAFELPAVPTISGLSPGQRGVNTVGFQLTVNGTGFVATSVVRWAGASRTTTFVSPTQLRAQILASDVQAAQTVSVTVFTPAPGGGPSIGSNFNIVSCLAVTGPGSVEAPRNGGSYGGQVTAISGCAWTATASETWITGLTPGGSGDGSVNFTVQPNNGPARFATITIRIPATGSTALFSVEQAGCNYSLVAVSLSVPATSATYSANLSTESGCVWTAVSNHPFITIAQGSPGNGPGAFGFTVAANTGPARVGTITVTGNQTFTVNQAAGTALRRTASDFDADGKTDIGIFRPAAGEWWINRSSNGQTFALQFGVSTDRIVPADYTGDGRTDVAFWRPGTGEWFVLRSEDFSFYAFTFGTGGDIPVPADYDNDGRADAAVFRPSTATWFIVRSTGGTTIEQFGATGDVPVPADYDGDGRADLAIFRPSNGQWWLKRSTAGVIASTFGNSQDKPVQGDYTGDGKADVALWRPSTGEWFILRSEDFSYYSAPLGISTDKPAPGDYDGDGKVDPTVFRPSTATWFSQRSTAGMLIQQFGANGDRVIPGAFVP